MLWWFPSARTDALQAEVLAEDAKGVRKYFLKFLCKPKKKRQEQDLEASSCVLS